jgi:hypothetical protein
MRYLMPRLATFMTTGAGMDAKGGGSGGGKGGGGLKGAGETQLEVGVPRAPRPIILLI